MKFTLMLTIAAAVLSATASRALDIPRTVHRTADLTKAFDEAAKSKRGILWIYTDSKLKPSWPTCSGTVSVAVMKQGRGMGEVVFIDSSGEDMSKAPDAVKEAIKGAGGSLPIVALSNAAGDKVYGTASHKALIGGLDKALKDAKRAMRADTTPGGLKPAAAPAEKSASGETKEPASGDIKVTDNKGTKEVTGAPLEDWVSNKGTTLNARLTKVAGPKVTLVTDADKTITVNQSDLSPESFKRLQEIIGQ